MFCIYNMYTCIYTQHAWVCGTCIYSTYMYLYVSIYKHIIYTTECNFVVCVHTVSGLITFHWTTNKQNDPGKESFFSQQSLVAYSSLSKGPCEFSPFLVNISINISIASSLVSAAIDSRECLTADFLILWVLQSFCPFFHNVLWEMQEEMGRSTHWGWDSHDLLSFVLWFSVIVSDSLYLW